VRKSATQSGDGNNNNKERRRRTDHPLCFLVCSCETTEPSLQKDVPMKCWCFCCYLYRSYVVMSGNKKLLNAVMIRRGKAAHTDRFLCRGGSAGWRRADSFGRLAEVATRTRGLSPNMEKMVS
jgi:hypothetical protein